MGSAIRSWKQKHPEKLKDTKTVGNGGNVTDKPDNGTKDPDNGGNGEEWSKDPLKVPEAVQRYIDEKVQEAWRLQESVR